MRVTRERRIQIAIGAATVVAIAALVAWSCWQRWTVLAASPFPIGVDGFYYPIQLRALLEDGTLHYPASPLTFWFMLPFAAVTDPFTGAKLGAALGGALIAIPAYGVAAHVTKQRGPGLLAAAIATTSASSAYLSIEFVKQGVGLTVALAALWLVLRALSTPSRARVAAALAGIVAAVLAHKLAAAVVLALALPAGFEEMRARGLVRGRRLIYLCAVLATLAIGLVVAGLVAPRRFLSATDLALVRELFGEPHWDLPALVRPGMTLTFGHEALIGTALALAAAAVLALRIGAKRSRSERVVGWGVVALGLAIGLPWLDVTDAQGLGFRLRLAAFVPLAICSAIVAGALVTLVVSGSTRSATWRRDGALATLALLIAMRAHETPNEGRVVAHPALVSAVMAATTNIPEGATVIVPERHILFMVAWYTRAPVSLRPESIPYGRRVRLLPLHFIQIGSPLDEAIDAARRDPRVTEPPIGLHARHRNGLVLVGEPTWDWLMAALPAGVRGRWARWPTI